MNTIKTLLSTVALLAASTLFAQSGSFFSTLPTGEDGPGVIGKRYAEVGFSLQDPQHYSDVATAFGTSANVPVTKNIDLGLGYSYSKLNYAPQGASPGTAVDSKASNIGASALFYNTIEKGIKPFMALNLGTTFEKTTFRNTNHDTTYQWWGVSAGAEFPYKWVSVIASLSYDDDFVRSGFSYQAWTVKTEVNTWITDKIGAYVGLAYTDPMHNYVNSWTYSIGARVRF